MTKANKRKLIFGLVGAIALILLLNAVYVVQEGQYKVVLKFGEAVRYSESPGLHMKIPFIENTMTLPKRQMTYDSSPTQILTKDKKPIIVDNYTIWRIDEPEKFLRTLKSVGVGVQRIDAAVYNTVRRKLSEINYDEIISEDTARGNINDEITKDVAEALRRDNSGIQIIDVRIKRTDLPDGNKQSVYNRMISDRQSIAARYLSEGDENRAKLCPEPTAKRRNCWRKPNRRRKKLWRKAKGKRPGSTMRHTAKIRSSMNFTGRWKVT